jgi:hypothetical protein
MYANTDGCRMLFGGVIVTDTARLMRNRAAIKFLMGLGTNPELTARDQRELRKLLRGPFANGFATTQEARRALDNSGWQQ